MELPEVSDPLFYGAIRRVLPGYSMKPVVLPILRHRLLTGLRDDPLVVERHHPDEPRQVLRPGVQDPPRESAPREVPVPLDQPRTNSSSPDPASGPASTIPGLHLLAKYPSGSIT